MIYNEKTADEPEPWERELMVQISAKQSLVDSWNQAFHNKGPVDIVYVAELQRRIGHLKRKLTGDI